MDPPVCMQGVASIHSGPEQHRLPEVAHDGKVLFQAARAQFGERLGEKLVVFQLYDQQSNIPLAVVPIVVLDMWEHAFYLDYVNVKADYVKAWWNIVNWQDAAARFERAKGSSLVVL